jgi:D-alanyl-D-alanine carboxypeptidase/D-alanyl-D-alanine-endopeptidase (penicillin-binding protein 4)
VTVGLFPLACGLEVDNGGRSVSGRGSRLEISLLAGGEAGRVVVRGTLGTGGDEVRTYRRVPEPATYALACLRDALHREGVTVSGGLQRGTAPDRARLLARHRSRPLYQIVSDMNKYSNNVMAESLVKLLGATPDGPGTTRVGLARLETRLRERGVETSGWALADGSGLSRSGRVTAQGIAGALRVALADPALAPEMVTSLAAGGDVGTLSDRLLTSGRRVRAKTGTLSGAVSLAGYAYPRDGGGPVIFAFLINGPAADRADARQALDRAALRLLDLPPPGAGRAAAPR